MFDLLKHPACACTMHMMFICIYKFYSITDHVDMAIEVS